MKNTRKKTIVFLTLALTALTPLIASAHTHVYTTWEEYGSSRDPLPFGSSKCYIKVIEWVRVCVDCGDIDTKTTKESIPHNMVNGLCSECGFGNAK